MRSQSLLAAAARCTLWFLSCFVTLADHSRADMLTASVRAHGGSYSCNQSVSSNSDSVGPVSCSFTQGSLDVEARASGMLSQLGGDLSASALAFGPILDAPSAEASVLATGSGTYIFSGSGISANLGIVENGGSIGLASCDLTFSLGGSPVHLGHICRGILPNAYQIQFGIPYQISFAAMAHAGVTQEAESASFRFSLQLPDGVTATAVPESDTFILTMVGLLPLGFRRLRLRTPNITL